MTEIRESPPHDDTHRDQQLEAVIADYIRACESGAAPNRREFLERHPELADELRQFFGQRDRMNQMAEPIRGFRDALAQVLGPGQRLNYVGNYELLAEIARGGMGVVYKARQTTLGRIVAVKMIVSGRLATEQDVQRFQVEAQAAAGLQHPHIVSIHEVGQHEGCHYFSMDYVDGRDLAAILRDNLLSAKQAAAYVRQMAEAIHYAHQQGILHRDLKPSNVLIDNHDQVRITDFGLAVRVEGDNELTRTGQIVGTPSYMPPEQAQGKRSLIGSGSDIYSLGAVLYECLTGRAPFRADSALTTLEQVIHVEPTSPRLLNPGVSRDLETICLKCLQKEPHRRYDTAKLLADDLQRFLLDQPILAQPLGSFERTWRRCRQYPAVTALIAAVALCLVMGTSISLHFAIEANARAASEIKLRQLADDERRTAREQERRAVAANERSADSLKDALAAVEQMLTRVAQERLVNVPQMEPVRKELMEEALNFYEKFLQKNNDDPLIRQETAGAYRRMADIYRRLGRYTEAEECYRKAFEMFEQLDIQSALDAHSRYELIAAHFEVAECYKYLSRQEEREEHGRLSVDIAERLANQFPNNPEYANRLADAAALFSNTIAETRPAEAESLLRRYLTLATSAGSLEQCHRILGVLLHNQNRNSEAVPLLRKAVEISEQLVVEDPWPIWRQFTRGFNLRVLGSALAEQGQLDEAEGLLALAVNLWDKLAADFPTGPEYRMGQAEAHLCQALLLSKRDRIEAAEQAHRRALDLCKLLAADFPNTFSFAVAASQQHLHLANLLERAGRTDEALQVYRDAVALMETASTRIPDSLGQLQAQIRCQRALALLLAKVGNTQEADSLFRRAAEIELPFATDFRSNVSRELAQFQCEAAQWYIDAGRWDEAARLCRVAMRSHAKLAADFPAEPSIRQTLAGCYINLAKALMAQDQFEEVSGVFGRYVETWKKLAADTPEGREHREQMAKAFSRTLLSPAPSVPADRLAALAAVAAYDQLATEFPHEPSFRCRLGWLCRALARKGHQTAEMRRRDIDAFASLVDEFPDDSVWQEHLAHAHREWAFDLKSQNRPEDSEQNFLSAIRVLEQSVVRFPAEVYHKKLLGHTYRDLAGLLAANRRPADAEHFNNRALDTFDRLAVEQGRKPDSPAAQK